MGQRFQALGLEGGKLGLQYCSGNLRPKDSVRHILSDDRVPQDPKWQESTQIDQEGDSDLPENFFTLSPKGQELSGHITGA